MPWWLSMLGAVIAAIATFVISWSALRPRQRLFATRFAARWTMRVALTFGLFYFLWVNAAFLMKNGPIERLELIILFVANAQTLFLFLVHVFVKAFSQFLHRRNERWERLTDRVTALEAQIHTVRTGRSEKKSTSIS